ncbi:hypothetical protein HPB50_022003 [Hyalomma asiaticum]|uniref:Uncharacterized protein n=1 Tax=Hyalomma asiaticum TaxID=266040 RepID=A0ACB7T134_HYAAI|nr:hypothetical protein HPB50_022003 [Hyalomma asiaticum]
MVTGSWWSVSQATIRYCWHKSGLSPMQDANEQEEEHDEVIDSGMWTEVYQQLDVDSGASFEDYVQCDSELVTCAELSDLEIVSSVRPEPEEEECDEEVVTAEADSNPVTLAEVVSETLCLSNKLCQRQCTET